MKTVNKSTLQNTVDRIIEAARKADTSKDGVLTGSEVRKAVNGRQRGPSSPNTPDERLLLSVYKGALGDRFDTAPITVVIANLEAAKTKLLTKADKDTNGTVEKSEVYTRGNNVKKGIGNMAARLFDATAGK